MATSIGIGFSSLTDPVQAFREAAIQAKTVIQAPIADLVLVFCTPGYLQQEALDGIRKILQPKCMLGTVTPAMILSEGIEPRGVAILAIASSEIQFTCANIDQISLQPLREAGSNLGNLILKHTGTSQRQALLLFYNGLRRNNTPFLLGLQDTLGRLLPITGGCAGDSHTPKESLQLCNDHILRDGAAGLLISGHIMNTAIAAQSGWQPLGKPRIITGAEANIIRLIDGKPAASLYQDYFRDELSTVEQGALGDIGLLYPLGISYAPGTPYTIMQPVEVLGDGSIVCQSEVRRGARVHLMIAKKDALRDSLLKAASAIRDRLMGKLPRLVLVFSSSARQKALGRGALQDIHLIKETLGLTTPVFGMYTYGEIVPVTAPDNSKSATTHNATIVLMAIG